jgi:hypothetical protein
MSRRIAQLMGLVVLCAAGCTCGDDGRHLSGTVTFDGKPVAAGVIYFDPDGTKGHTGSQGYAVIKNGRFDTRDGGRPTSPGPLIARVSGGDGVITADLDMGRTLFLNHPIHFTSSPSGTPVDLSVPASARFKEEVGTRTAP